MARWIRNKISSGDVLASGLVRSVHRHMRGPDTSKRDSCSLKRTFSWPKCGSFLLLLSCSLTSAASFGASRTRVLGLGKSLRIISFSSSAKQWLKCFGNSPSPVKESTWLAPLLDQTPKPPCHLKVRQHPRRVHHLGQSLGWQVSRAEGPSKMFWCCV